MSEHTRYATCLEVVHHAQKHGVNLFAIAALQERRHWVENDDARLEPSNFAQHDGQIIDLSPTEFALLEFLMRNESRVLSQSQILDHVWGYDSWPESNLVAVYVTYLRRKFKRLQIPIDIKSIRGVGYVLGD